MNILKIANERRLLSVDSINCQGRIIQISDTTKHKDDMFRVVSNYSDEEFLKPMNCPQHTQIYASAEKFQRFAYATDFHSSYRRNTAELMDWLEAFIFKMIATYSREDRLIFEVDTAQYTLSDRDFHVEYKYRLSTRDPKKFDSYLGDPKT